MEWLMHLQEYCNKPYHSARINKLVTNKFYPLIPFLWKLSLAYKLKARSRFYVVDISKPY